MLNRQKIVDQFEQLVQQEIKNHNDQVLATNMTMAKFQQKLIELRGLAENMSAIADSKVQRFRTELDLLRTSVLELKDKTISHSNTNLSERSRIEKKQNELLDSVVSLNTSVKNIETHIARIDDFNIQTRQCIVNLLGMVNEETYQTRKINEYQNKKVKEEILSIPSGIPELKNELEQKIATSYVDFQGAMRELEIVKRTSFIQEKQIENLYTLIERLEKGSSPCHKQESST